MTAHDPTADAAAAAPTATAPAAADAAAADTATILESTAKPSKIECRPRYVERCLLLFRCACLYD